MQIVGLYVVDIPVKFTSILVWSYLSAMIYIFIEVWGLQYQHPFVVRVDLETMVNHLNTLKN